VAELMARIRVALHHARVAVADRPRLITAGAVTIDLDAKLLTRGGTPVRLTYMANLRKKLDDPSAPQLLLTEPGMGYRFVVPDAG
jgi:DNA-binding response OmpR family regulator